jgi:hypothetical protein
MPSHAVSQLVEARPDAKSGRVDVRMVLACGCEVELSLEPARLCETVEGRTLVVGKYPCPVNHPVGSGPGYPSR